MGRCVVCSKTYPEPVAFCSEAHAQYTREDLLAGGHHQTYKEIMRDRLRVWEEHQKAKQEQEAERN